MSGSAYTHFTYQTPLGRLTIASDGSSICVIAFGEQLLAGERRPTELTNRASNQLQEYFAGKRRAFDLPLAPAGTAFQKRVWSALADIPYGETRTYGDIAAAIGNPRACRAVGGANNRNPLPIVVPCHRVIGANGSLTGYDGGVRIKAFLLDLERRVCEEDAR